MKNIFMILALAGLIGFASCAGDSSTATATTEKTKSSASKDDLKSKKVKNIKASIKDDTGGTNFTFGEVSPGAELPLKGIDGKVTNLKEANGENGLLVLYSCNTCPYVVAWEDRYPLIAEHCKANNVGLLVVNSNEAKRDGDDSIDAMKKHAKELNYNFSYVVDNNHKLADAMGATRTPDLFLLDKDLKLVYRGAIDDNMKMPKDVKAFYIKDAISNMVAGKPIDPHKTKSIGCTIKRVKA